MRVLLGLTIALVAAAMPSLAAAGQPPATTPAAATTPDEATIKKLVTDLGDKTFAVRDSAGKRLIEIGLPSRPALLAAAKSDDPEVSLRARAALEVLVEVTVKDLGLSPLAVGGAVLVSPNGEHVAYVKEVAARSHLFVCDGKDGPAWDGYILPFSYTIPNNNSVPDPPRMGNDGLPAYLVHKDDLNYVTRAGQEDKAKALPVNESPVPVVSTDGKHMAYAMKTKDGQEAIVLDGKEGPPHAAVSPSQLLFSPDGRTLAYPLASDKHFWVVGDTKLGPYERVGPLAFSPDSKRYAYAAEVDGKMKVIFDGKAGEAYDEIARILFMPDSGKLAYAAYRAVPAGGGVLVAVLDGKEVSRFEVSEADAWVAMSTCALSPDGKHIAWAAHNGREWYVAVDGKALPQVYYTDAVISVNRPGAGPGVGAEKQAYLSAPAFSADGRHVFFRVRISEGFKRLMVIDGIARPKYNEVWIPRDFQNYPKALRYVVRDGDRLRLVETYWPEDTTWRKAVGVAEE
jgi:hypothetical protein